MDRNVKLSTALGLVLDNERQIEAAKAKVSELEMKRGGVLAEAIRVMKCSGKDQVLFRGTIFTVEIDPKDKEDEGNNDFLNISVFEGLVLSENGKDGTSQ